MYRSYETNPTSISSLYKQYLNKKAIPQKDYVTYRKWLRYYLDFCHKYQNNQHNQLNKDNIKYFMAKLKEKEQNTQRNQAFHAISLYYESEPANSLEDTTFKNKNINLSTKNENFKSINTNWVPAFDKLKNEITLRHYSPKTLRSYSGWVSRFQDYARSKDTKLLTSNDVKDYVTYLAVKRKVSASSQNQAFNALLFFFRHVLKNEFGDMKDIPRAKRKPYIPVVLSKDEVETMISNLTSPYDLVVKLLYGCGLRLFECLNLRVGCFNFDAVY